MLWESHCAEMHARLQIDGPNERLQQRASEAKRVCCKPGLCSGPCSSERETALVEDSRRAWVEPTGESPAATRAAVGAFIEGTIAVGSTGTERNRALERPGAWALLGRAGDDTWTEPEAKERACTLDDRAASRGAAR